MALTLIIYINTLCFAADGASTMLGSKAGVAALLTNNFPDLLVWHCSSHRLELAVSDTVKEVNGMNNLQSFVDKLFTATIDLFSLRKLVS